MRQERHCKCVQCGRTQDYIVVGVGRVGSPDRQAKRDGWLPAERTKTGKWDICRECRMNERAK